MPSHNNLYLSTESRAEVMKRTKRACAAATSCVDSEHLGTPRLYNS